MKNIYVLSFNNNEYIVKTADVIFKMRALHIRKKDLRKVIRSVFRQKGFCGQFQLK